MHNKCNGLNHPRTIPPWSVETALQKPILGAKKRWDHCLTRWHQMPAKSPWPQPQEWNHEPLPTNTHAPLVFPVDSLPAFLNLSLSFSAFGTALYLMKWLSSLCRAKVCIAWLNPTSQKVYSAIYARIGTDVCILHIIWFCTFLYGLLFCNVLLRLFVIMSRSLG